MIICLLCWTVGRSVLTSPNCVRLKTDKTKIRPTMQSALSYGVIFFIKPSLKTCSWHRQGPAATCCEGYSQENVAVINDRN